MVLLREGNGESLIFKAYGLTTLTPLSWVSVTDALSLLTTDRPQHKGAHQHILTSSGWEYPGSRAVSSLLTGMMPGLFTIRQRSIHGISIPNLLMFKVSSNFTKRELEFVPNLYLQRFKKKTKRRWDGRGEMTCKQHFKSLL